ncbi:hypothetical protein TCAL_06297, partial [Tigriopus californicus]
MEIRAKSYQECFNLEKGGQIESETCDNIDNGAFLCEFICPDSWILQAESCGNVPIPPKFSKVGNHFYQYLRERRLTWSRAESECISETGGNLPILKTKEDVDSLTEVIQFLEGEKQDQVPIGLYGSKAVSCANQECLGQLIWNTGEPLSNSEDFLSVSFRPSPFTTSDKLGTRLNDQGHIRIMTGTESV